MKTLAQEIISMTTQEATDDLSPETKARHDKENAQLAKLTVEQINLLKAVQASANNTFNLVGKYADWLKRNKVQAHMSKAAETLASDIIDTLDGMKDVL